MLFHDMAGMISVDRFDVYLLCGNLVRDELDVILLNCRIDQYLKNSKYIVVIT